MHMCTVRPYLRFCQVAGNPEIQQNQKHRAFQKTSCFPEYHQICGPANSWDPDPMVDCDSNYIYICNYYCWE